jgi:hypothetical protein
MSTELATRQSTDIVQPSEATEVAIAQMNQITDKVIGQIKFDRGQNDEMYEFFKDQIEIDGDKNPASREAMFKARELNMKATDQMIELIKIKAKMITPARGTSIQINLNNNFDSDKGGDTSDMIDLIDSIEIEIPEN